MRQFLRYMTLCMMLLLALCMVVACDQETPNEPVATEPEESEPEESEPEESEPAQPAKLTYALNEYKLIRSENASQDVKDKVLSLWDTLKRYAPSLDLGDDWYYSGDAEKIKVAKEILYGDVNREETKTIIKSMPDDKDYVIAFLENKIVLYGVTQQSLDIAVSEFTKMVKSSTNATLVIEEEGAYIYGVDPSLGVSLSPREFVNYPKFTRIHTDAVLCSEYGVQYLYADVTDKAVTEYMERLAAAGLEKMQEVSGNGNRTATFCGNGGTVHLAYTSSAGMLVVSADNGTSALYKKPEDKSWVKLTANSFAVMTMDYSTYSCSKGCLPRYDNNGLSYVITLEDGRFIVYDGGYENPNDSQILYEYMRDTNKREGLPVIAAWVFTHSHGDHYGAFKSFTGKHKNDVVIEAFVLNTGKDSCYTGGGHDSFLESVDGYAKTYYKTEQVIKLHVGQQLYFGNVTIEGIYTHEMFHFDDRNLTNENSATLITRVWMDGVSFMMLGDAGEDTCLGAAALHGSYLKSDFMQIAHHGNGGGRRELYSLVDPDYMLWTTSQPGFRRRTAGSAYSVGMPSAYIAKLNKEMFDHVGGVRSTITANGAYNAEGVQTNWCADGPVDILTVGPDKKINVSYYEIRQELLPNNPIEDWDAAFLPDNR